MATKLNENESFGEYLKRERNMRGVTLDEISRSTNVSKRFLEALENDDYDALPPDVFVKGFIRAYAKCIGFDPHEITLAYSEHASKKKDQDSSEKSINFVEKEKRNKFFTLLFFLACALFAVVTVIKITKKKQPTTPLEKAIFTNQKETELLQKAAPPAPTTKQQSPKVEKEKKTAVDDSPQNKEPALLVLTIYAADNVWLRIITDQGEPKEALLNVGEQVTYKAQERFLLTLGNVKGSIVTLNGEELLFPKNNSNIIRDHEIRLDAVEEEMFKD